MAAQENLFSKFMKIATLHQISDLIAVCGIIFKGNHKDFIDLLKRLVFLKSEQELDIHRHVWKGKNSKRYPTEFLVDPQSKSITLFISSKDSHDLDAMYVRLYDTHMDQMFQWISSRNSVPDDRVDIKDLLRAVGAKNEEQQREIDSFIADLDKQPTLEGN